ncbi:MAG: hypothetical protein CK425_02175 [Parachlamydia sp.]|nr:MAG: hypothetical protein CK425_02175 [Parachlamydia sp.]
MTRLFLSLALAFSYLTSFCQASDAYQSLLDATSHYVNFLNKYTSDGEGSDIEEIKSLFTPQFRKSINGELFDETHESMLEKLEHTRIVTGGWYVQILNLLIAPQTQASTIYYLCTTAEGSYATVAMLHFNEDHLITEVHMVYNRFAGRDDQVHISETCD